jgi:hypothetical protein
MRFAWVAVVVMLAATASGADVKVQFRQSTRAAPLAVVLAPPGHPIIQQVLKQDWNVLIPEGVPTGDAGILALVQLVARAEKMPMVLPNRNFLIATGEQAWMAFYAASRAAGLFAASLADGSPRPAMDSNRLFAANSANGTVFWTAPANQADPEERSRLSAAGFPFQPVNTVEEGITRLAGREAEEFPAQADCETGNPAFGLCHWVQILRVDAGRRNDALGTTRVKPLASATLSIGPFEYDASIAGPPVVTSLPEGYKGPLQKDDRIVAMDGKAVDSPAAYLGILADARQEKSVTVMIQRGRDRKRVEAKIVPRQLEETFTGRLQGQYLQDAKEILLVSRGVGALRLDVPPQWVGATVNWNGEELGKEVQEGCWIAVFGGRLQRCPVK